MSIIRLVTIGSFLWFILIPFNARAVPDSESLSLYYLLALTDQAQVDTEARLLASGSNFTFSRLQQLGAIATGVTDGADPVALLGLTDAELGLMLLYRPMAVTRAFASHVGPTLLNRMAMSPETDSLFGGSYYVLTNAIDSLKPNSTNLEKTQVGHLAARFAEMVLRRYALNPAEEKTGGELRALCGAVGSMVSLASQNLQSRELVAAVNTAQGEAAPALEKMLDRGDCDWYSAKGHFSFSDFAAGIRTRLDRAVEPPSALSSSSPDICSIQDLKRELKNLEYTSDRSGAVGGYNDRNGCNISFIYYPRRHVPSSRRADQEFFLLVSFPSRSRIKFSIGGWGQNGFAEESILRNSKLRRYFN